MTCYECAPTVLNFTAFTNADFVLPVKATDFVGATFASKLKYPDDTLAATFTITTPSATTGFTFDQRLTPAQLGALPPGDYYFDTLATLGGVATNLLIGRITLVKGRT